MRLAVLAACVAFAAPSAVAATSGLRGVVTKGPTQPVCRIGTPCTAPAPHVVLTFVRGTVTRSVRADAGGHYRIALPAGLYAVRVTAARFGFSPRSVSVPAGRVAVRNFQIDTGIR